MDSCNIKVAIKARPLNHKEELDGRVYWKIESDNSMIRVDPSTQKKNGDQFFFDKVFCGKSTNYDVFYNIVRPIIDKSVQGFNGTVLAYGETASGKTHTMSGNESNPGIIPLAINYMFYIMNSSTNREYLLRASYVEIYNENCIDLLEKKDEKNQVEKIEIQKEGLNITPIKAVVCQNAQTVMDLIKIGEQNRSIREINTNEKSSKSHTIFHIILESHQIGDDIDEAYQKSVINLVDLAGSEQSSQTHSPMEQIKNNCKINSSLTTLELVVKKLGECPDSPQHMYFYESTLTRILQTSLGENSLTAIICTITLAVDNQTQNTLSFASRAKNIKKVKVNKNVIDFGHHNKEFKIPLESFKLKFIKNENRSEDTKSINEENTDHDLSLLSTIACETSKHFSRVCVNNYQNMFESSSMKENNELKKFTTLDGQMLYENNTQFHSSIDSDYRDGKKKLVQGINFLEPGTITSIPTRYNLLNLLDMFFSLILTKEQQIITNLSNEQTKIKEQYEEQLKQLQGDIKKEKEWREQVENDNEMLCLELEHLKSQKRNFPSSELKIKELTQQLLETEIKSFNNLKELQALKTQTNNYSSEEHFIQDFKTKIEDLTDKYNKSLSMYKEQKSSYSDLEKQIEKVWSERDCLHDILEIKNEHIKNLNQKLELITKDFEAQIENKTLQRKEIIKNHTKYVNQLQLELNEKIQKIYFTEKLLKEVNRKYNKLVEDNSTHLIKLKYLEENENNNLNFHIRVSELERKLSESTQNVKLLMEENNFLKNKCDQFKNDNNSIIKLNGEICEYEQNIYQLRKEKGLIILQHSKEQERMKSELNKNLELSNEYKRLLETARNVEKSLKETIQQLNRCIVEKNAKIFEWELFSKTNTDEFKKKNHELEHVLKKAIDKNHMLHKKLWRFGEMANVRKVDQCTQTAEEKSILCRAFMTDHKSMTEKITKLENDNHMMKKMLHYRKTKIEELQKQLSERL